MMREVGTYDRELAAPLPRLIENALDWEHLPHLHATDFAGIAVVDADHTGWSAEVTLPGGGVLDLDLRLDRDRLGWTTKSRSAGRIVSRIASRAAAVDAATCRVSVAFFADVPEGSAAQAGEFYRTLYARLYDEDEAMMIARQAALQRDAAAKRETRTAVLAGGELVSIPVYCPHQGLPLSTDPDGAGILTCPWHGYRFDARTGDCVSGPACRWQA
jgi:nitrite reductase/ring-hydroxylating ferredoxin subunit